MAVSVRPVCADDFLALLPLWDQIVEANPGLDVSSLLRRIDESVSGGPLQLLVAWEGQRAVGLVGIALVNTSTWSEQKSLTMQSLIVAKDSRHRGVAKSMLRYVAMHAEELGAHEIVAHVPSRSRETARFFASFGFTESSTRRVAQVANLRRKLATREQIVAKGVVPRRITRNDLVLRRATNK